MNLKKNEIEIIKLLIASTNYISSYDIATATGINRRLVRDEMLNIKKILKSLGYELISKTSKGYIIEGKSSVSLQSLATIIEDAERQRESIFPTLPWERQNYIIKRLIDKNDYMKIDDLADELLISRSTISCDLKQARQTVLKYGLTMHQKPNYGICIVGDEVNKRKPICDYLFTNLRQSEMFYDYLNSYIVEKDSLEYGIIKIIKKHEVEMSDIALCDFLLSLSVSITRILSGSTIHTSQDLSIIEGRQEFLAAYDIAVFVEKRINCHMNQNEINQIAIQLICKRSSKGTRPINKPETIALVNEILDEICKQTLLEFNDQKFKTVFTLYIEAALIRIAYHEKIRNPLYDELKTTYPLAYELAEITSSVIQKYTHQSLSMSELAFFAIIFNTHIHNRKVTKKRVLLLCGLGGGAEDLSASQILERFENQINIIKTSQYYKLPDEDLSQYDFIISTVPIHKQLLIPYINISQIINQDDLDKIENYLSYLFNKNRIETIFHPKLFKSHAKSRNKTDVINEFYKMLKCQYPTLKESFKNTLLMKEQRTIITYKNKIGIIKLNKPLNNNNILAVLILNNPITWDKQTIQIIILFSCLDTNNYIYNTLTNTLTNLNVRNVNIKSLLDHAQYADFLRIMIKHQS
ncbi:BglG family transcription antiterminator [Candidatus Stoquefichus massiliensis]|uniref:BglG family transcription antiterminator n=1 Tax=Candidatus Stoquefichus massiliensis TaxID=1470350 RepID=UPI0004821251|nr:PRD domain-containing protein [Candidatus Stoquefichus massiliensis]